MSAESRLPPMEPTFSTGSHSRYSCMSGSSENSAVIGAGTQPDSRFAVE